MNLPTIVAALGSLLIVLAVVDQFISAHGHSPIAALSVVLGAVCIGALTSACSAWATPADRRSAFVSLGVGLFVSVTVLVLGIAAATRWAGA